MNSYNPAKHHRRSIRLRGYDYSQLGLYFVTLVCQDRAPLFGEVRDGIMYLNEIGRIASEELLHTQEVRDNIVLHEYIVMPDHIHRIIEIQYPKAATSAVGVFQSPGQTIGAIIRGYKIATIKRIKSLMNKGFCKGELQFAPTSAPTKIWQRNYYEHIIRSERAYRNMSRHIINNPRKWSEKEGKVVGAV